MPNTTEAEEVVMTPLQAPVGITVLKVERVPGGLLDRRAVHYVAGGRYRGIIINRAANERPDYRDCHVRRNFTCYIGAKAKSKAMREQRQLRFWFRYGSNDGEPMADRFFKELLNPHLFPKDYIGYVKRILELLQGFPTVSKMELEMRPARADELDQEHVVRRLGRGRPSSSTSSQDDYHTWHSPKRGGSRGELGSPVGTSRGASRGELGSPVGRAPYSDRGATLDRSGRRMTSQEDAELSHARLKGNVITQWSSAKQEPRRYSTRSPSPGATLDRWPSRQSSRQSSQDSVIECVNSPALGRTLDRRRYSIDSFDSADFKSPSIANESIHRTMYTSSPRPDRKGGAHHWTVHQEHTQTQAYTLTSRSPSPARVIRRVPVVQSRTLTAAPPPPKKPGLSSRGVQLLWVARRYRVLQFLEDAYPNSATVEELLRYYRLYALSHKMDLATLGVILYWLSRRGLVGEVEKGNWMRMETTRSAGHKAWTHTTKIVTSMPALAPHELPTVAIVTLLFAEKLAVDAMIDNKSTYVLRRAGEGQVVTFGNIGHVRVVATKLPKPGEGESAMYVARNATTRVIGTFGSVGRVLLIGCAGGIAHYTDDRRHIRRGDVVVAKPRNPRSPMYIFCTGTEMGKSGDHRFTTRNWVTSDDMLEELLNTFEERQKADPYYCPWLPYIAEGKRELEGGDLSFQRPSPNSDRLMRFSPDGVPKEVRHPIIRRGSTRDLHPNNPVVQYGVVGGGEPLLKSDTIRRRFALLTEAKAIDPGFQPVLEAIEGVQKDSVAIIRGVADYSDGRSGAHWQPYAALTAAAYMKALLMEFPRY